MKLIISTILTAIVTFLLGWLFYGMLFLDYFNEHMGQFMRPEHDFKMWAIIVGSILKAFMMSIIYAKYFMKGVSPAKEGLKFGLMIGLLLAMPYIFFYWGGMKVAWQPVLIDGLILGFMTVVAGFVIGQVYGKAKVPPAESTA
jgi:hypothetical protein